MSGLSEVWSKQDWQTEAFRQQGIASRLAGELAEANKLLEQTIEVLEGLAGMAEGLSFAHWWSGNGQPLLDNLKAWKKEPK